MAEAPLISERSATSGQLCPARGTTWTRGAPQRHRAETRSQLRVLYRVERRGAPPALALHLCLVLRSLLREADCWGKACAPFLACRPRHEGTAGNSITAVSHAVSPPAAARGRSTGTNPQHQHELRPRSVRRRCAVPPWRTRTPRRRRPPANPPAKPLTFG